jgi:hypothetical protein
MGSVHARGDTFLTFGLKALTETNTSRLATALNQYTIIHFYGIWNADSHLRTGFFVHVETIAIKKG